MKEFLCTITNPAGIDTRRAGLIVKIVKSYDDTVVTITKDRDTVKASQLMKLMGLSIKQGDEVSVVAEGPDEDDAIATMKTIFRENLCSNDIVIKQEATGAETDTLTNTMGIEEWVHCPWCGNKTRLKIRADTEAKNLPWSCPRCTHESLIAVETMNISVTIEPDTKTQNR